MGKNFFKKTGFCEFAPDFQSESSFDLTKDRKIEMRGPFQCIKKNVSTPQLVLPEFKSYSTFIIVLNDILTIYLAGIDQIF